MTWSLSRLQTYEGCAMKYKFRYVDGLKSDAGPAAARGQLKHKNIEDYVNGIGQLSEDLAHYGPFLDHTKTLNCIAEIQMGLNDQWKPVPYEDASVWLRAVLDLLVVGAVEATVFDWKSGKIYDKHEDQRDLYSVVVLATHPEIYQVRAVHVYLDQGRNREKTIHRDQARAIQEKFEARVARMEADKEWIPNPTFMCRYCSFSRFNGGGCKF